MKKFKFIFQPNFYKIIEGQSKNNGLTISDIAAQYGLSGKSLNKFLYNQGFLVTDANGDYTPQNKSYAKLFSHERSNNVRKYKTVDGSACFYNNTPYYNKDGYTEIYNILKNKNILPLNQKILETPYETNEYDTIVSIREPNWINSAHGNPTGKHWTIFKFNKDKLHNDDVVGSWNCQPISKNLSAILGKEWRVTNDGNSELFYRVYNELGKQFVSKHNIKDLVTKYSKENKKLLKALI